MVFWYFGTAFLGKSHHAGGEDMRSTETILHPTRAAKQGSFCSDEHLTLCAREASAAAAASFKRGYRKSRLPGVQFGRSLSGIATLLSFFRRRGLESEAWAQWMEALYSPSLRR